MIEIDGSYLEGGGQIVRTSIALSALTKKPVHIYNIRANRKPSGLKHQHLSAILAVSKLYNAELKNAYIGSEELFFYPREVSKNYIEVKLETSGSVCLVLQTIFLALSNTKEHIRVKINGGGTFGKWAPSISYLENVFLPTLKKFGFNAEIKIIRHGFYPKGGAKVIADVYKSELKGKIIERNISRICGISISSKNLKKAQVSERQMEGVLEVLKDYKLNIKPEHVDTLSPGSAIDLWTEDTRIGANYLGEIGLKAEKVGKMAGILLNKNIISMGSTDPYLADQLIPFISLAEGESKYTTRELTNHTKTNIWVVEKFIDRKFIIRKKQNLYEIMIS
ncbi:MAG: RNA 3'-phosphate cyclase [Candidatus Aenigmarchaeota archaeon ex4484_56]|nr:MAG: RNA 3'-phosphate cyclase [Candidatus Aenigmarchaeota archaeon ex4484_56]